MTSAAPVTSASSTSRGGAKGSGSALQWLKEPRNRYLALAAAVTAIGLVVWLVVQSGGRKEQYAGRALDQARSAAESGNFPLAASEFQKVITTFAGTRAAQEATINLNQVRLINGQHELAVVNLQDFLKRGPAEEFRSPAYGLLGHALENAKRPGEAAEAYLNGAKATEVGYLKAELLMQAGGAYASAGARDKAIAVYREVIKDHGKTGARTEAEVRLSELTEGQM